MDRKMAEAMADILYRVQGEVGYTFSFDEVFATAVQTRRKVDLNGKGDDYIPVLFENELKDLVMRNRINQFGIENYQRQIELAYAVCE